MARQITVSDSVYLRLNEVARRKVSVDAQATAPDEEESKFLTGTSRAAEDGQRQALAAYENWTEGRSRT